MAIEFTRPPQAFVALNGLRAPQDRAISVGYSVSNVGPSQDLEDGKVFRLEINPGQEPDLLPEYIYAERASFHLSRRIARVIAQKGFYEVNRESVSAVREYNLGQWGDTVGSVYHISSLGLVTSNRNDDKEPPVSKEVLVPLVTLINRDGKVIKFLPASQVVLDRYNKPVNDFFRLEEILSEEELEVYRKYYFDNGERRQETGRISIAERATMCAAEGVLSKFHKVRSFRQ